MRLPIAALLSLVTWLAGAAPVQAHEGGTHARGTVKEISAESLVLTTSTGADLRVVLQPGTRVVRGRRAIPAGEIHPGERAVVHASRREGALVATEVRVAEP